MIKAEEQIVNEKALNLHKQLRGKLEVKSRIKVTNSDVLSLAYNPGVADVCKMIEKYPEKVFEYTNRWNNVAVVSDGSAILGLGNIGPEAGLPVMEGKAILFKEFGNVDAFPLCIKTQESEKIIDFVEMLSPTFGGINLEDISSPRCFYIENELKKRLDIPVFHDDQHGTAIVVLAALKNALKIVNKKIEDVKIVTNGVGAAGGAIVKMLLSLGIKNIISCDKNGIINADIPETMLNDFHKEIAKYVNPDKLSGSISNGLKGADIFIGTSVGNVITFDMIKTMADNSIVFSLASPIPEIEPEIAKKAGAKVVATGRSDYPNQVNNVLAFPGLFRGALDVRAREINEEMELAAAQAIAELVPDSELSENFIIPKAFDPKVAKNIALKVAKAAVKSKVAKICLNDLQIEKTIDLNLKKQDKENE